MTESTDVARAFGAEDPEAPSTIPCPECGEMLDKVDGYYLACQSCGADLDSEVIEQLRAYYGVTPGAANVPTDRAHCDFHRSYNGVCPECWDANQPPPREGPTAEDRAAGLEAAGLRQTGTEPNGLPRYEVDGLSDVWEKQYEEVTRDWQIEVESDWPRKLIAIGLTTAIWGIGVAAAPITYAAVVYSILWPRRRRMHLTVRLGDRPLYVTDREATDEEKAEVLG